MISLAALDADRVRHAFFTRQGGVSGGIFASLNCGFGSGDDAEAVVRNRAIAMDRLALPGERLVTCRQHHSADVVTVERLWTREASPCADGLVTGTSGIALGILTADCAPVLFCDPEAGIVGAAHAGWRGALAGVIEATVERMVGLGAVRGRIRAGIGPSITALSYEVGPEFEARFGAEDAVSTRFFAPASRAGHFLFDLPGYVADRLHRAGIAAIERADGDTAAEPERFFSYRRACRDGEDAYGRCLAAIALVD